MLGQLFVNGIRVRLFRPFKEKKTNFPRALLYTTKYMIKKASRKEQKK